MPETKAIGAFRKTAPAALLIALGWASAPAETFSLVILPDTQMETGGNPERFNGRMDWIVKKRDSLNVKFVMHVGDLVNWDTPDHIQFVRARAGMDILYKAGIPYAICVGNHDTPAVCPGGSACPGADTHANLRNTSVFNAFFPASRFQALAGTYEAGKIDNAYQTFTAAGMKWLVLTLELWARTAPINWAKTVVQNHPDHNVIVVTHMHLNSASQIDQSNGGYGDNSPQFVFDQLLKQYPNVRLVLNGHVGTHGYRVDTGIKGNRIYQYLQCYHDGNANPQRILEINTAAGTMKSSVYMPSTGAFKQDGSAFTVSGVTWVPPKTVGTAPHGARPERPERLQGDLRIRYSLMSAGPVAVDVFGMGNRRVARLAGGSQRAGDHEVTWDGKDTRGRRVAPGVYLAVLQAGGASRLVGKLMLD